MRLGSAGRVANNGWMVAACLVSAACGAKAPVSEAPQEEASSGSEERDGSADSLNVSGLHGTLSQQEIQNALEPRMLKFSRCVQKRSGDVEWVSGGMAFEFKVAVNGSVTSVYPKQSSMGDRETERCMLDVAKGTRFPAPHGGDAEFGWSLEVPLDPEVRSPVPWTAAEAGAVISARAPELGTQCGAGPYDLTAYVDVEGKVVAVGGAVQSETSAEQLDCVTQAVQGWVFPSPGSYAAKLNFQVD
ncbi:MAG: AgmX/PglI C-terminal domain-containing protein [Myxococcales bacterium]